MCATARVDGTGQREREIQKRGEIYCAVVENVAACNFESRPLISAGSQPQEPGSPCVGFYSLLIPKHKKLFPSTKRWSGKERRNSRNLEIKKLSRLFLSL